LKNIVVYVGPVNAYFAERLNRF